MKDFFIEITEDQIQFLYNRLKLSTHRIIEMVQVELAFKNIMKPKKHPISGFNDNEEEEFNKFQSLLENMNNIVYYNSLLLVSFSIFEFSFKALCKTVSSYICTSNEFKEPKSSVLDQCKKYLTDTKLIDFSQDDLKETYQRIKNVNKLRNLIAHHNGNLLKGNYSTVKENPDFDFYSSDSRLAVLGSGQVYIDDKDYILNFQNDSERFIQLIISNLEK